MSHITKSKPITYSNAVRAFNDRDVQEDIKDACRRLAQAMSTLVERFDAIMKQMHTIDMKRLTSPLKPRWCAIRKEFTELLWQYRTNAGFISGRLKLFCTSVLPLAARNIEGRSRRSHEECMQVLQSFMTVRTLFFLQPFHNPNPSLVSDISRTCCVNEVTRRTCHEHYPNLKDISDSCAFRTAKFPTLMYRILFFRRFV
ncbi:uncharacterized protein LACBIDRAFT_293545 [Laccaria bicolor S238N-H82]|uniref:Predicted protein n=1 Tax=Laccaria bicolor (strain S238N-H82 / ATCC MYA-4686) TaxID=486041 RepID=B0D424_LACBS|nr:uncharacterized protein LACBIDRAFT_293545 [Laccaria bicolor S238N-H82]EDR10255.1 predicted protein [Laccaria bicolor S238N-H82]|eukprot:XP_001878705.1 predicted protein [Laccaria bicolor S238N-H82]